MFGFEFCPFVEASLGRVGVYDVEFKRGTGHELPSYAFDCCGFVHTFAAQAIAEQPIKKSLRSASRLLLTAKEQRSQSVPKVMSDVKEIFKSIPDGTDFDGFTERIGLHQMKPVSSDRRYRIINGIGFVDSEKTDSVKSSIVFASGVYRVKLLKDSILIVHGAVEIGLSSGSIVIASHVINCNADGIGSGLPSAFLTGGLCSVLETRGTVIHSVEPPQLSGRSSKLVNCQPARRSNRLKVHAIKAPDFQFPPMPKLPGKSKLNVGSLLTSTGRHLGITIEVDGSKHVIRKDEIIAPNVSKALSGFKLFYMSEHAALLSAGSNIYMLTKSRVVAPANAKTNPLLR
ncbi:MAG: hypothetical protein CMJ78_10590 [Planctomycetaceae bacterium]|nr:hypothetical protein [Planctomycetaceae bacterium]